MDYVRMRAFAEELGTLAERLVGVWRVEIGPAGPVLALRRRPKRHAGALRRLRAQLDEQLRTTHPGHICAAPHIEHPALGRMRLPDAALVPEAALDEPGPAVDATRVLAVVEVVTPATPESDRPERLADYPAMGIAHYLIVDPRTGTIETHSDPCKGRYARKGAYIFGDTLPFGPWLIDTADFRRYGKAGN
ncbi:Uma2 family endonuclease [Streptomyces sp. NBC_00566]|uniref:Uma2 family endonuclease n=1 Tax=Streptomyces sp. NBC_00566 TaxID=2975778 RepID=UPI002E818BD9|nr:Uma2 family endonuclease [Streptomyces sp. NBC_00566]WUB88632.1 Uma2 family endonuclease [Streptomyces sp. NBC_00566]